MMWPLTLFGFVGLAILAATFLTGFHALQRMSNRPIRVHDATRDKLVVSTQANRRTPP